MIVLDCLAYPYSRAVSHYEGLVYLVIVINKGQTSYIGTRSSCTGGREDNEMSKLAKGVQFRARLDFWTVFFEGLFLRS